MDINREKNSQKDNQLPLRTVTTLILGFFPLILVGYLSFMARQDQEQLTVILNFMWVIGGVISAWVLYLQLSFMQSPLSDLNKTKGNLQGDLKHSLGLGAILVVLGFGFQVISPEFMGFVSFIGEISHDPTRQAVFLIAGLMLWAAYEELIRVFTLNRTWELVTSNRLKPVMVTANAIVFALVYAYQGWGAMAAAGLGGLLLGAYYQKKGRVLPLILSHYLLNLAVFIVRIYFA